MTTTIISTVIGSLILLLIVLSLKIVQLSHGLKLSDKENENIRTKFNDLEIKYSELNEKHIKEISNLKEAHFKEIKNLKETHMKEITSLQKKISKLSEDEDIFA